MKSMVIYFSATGRTRTAAERIKEMSGSDIYEIKPAVPYTKADLNWLSKKSRSSVEMKDKASRPEIIDDIPDLTEYGTVYLGFPIWWYVAPRIVNTFLEKADLKGKKIVLFATSGSSGFGFTLKGLEPSAPEAAFIEGSVLKPKGKDEDYRKVVGLG